MASKKNFLILLFLIFIVSISQFILAEKHLKFGFFTDDWLFLSLYRAFIKSPILDILNGWKNIESHNFAHAYYIGVLYNFFGLNYISYHVLNQILKIIATLTLYPLILIISKNKLLAFFSTIFFAIHYSPFGTLDNASRGEDFIAIALMNLFLAAYFYISKKGLSNILLIFGFAVWLFAIVFIDPTRLFPLIIIMPFLELIIFLQNRNKLQMKAGLKRMIILYSPFVPLFLFAPDAITDQLGYVTGIFGMLRIGNLQLFLTPFASFGSMYIPRDFWLMFGHPLYNNFGEYLQFLIFGPIFIFYISTALLGVFISKKPLILINRSLFLNIIAGLLVFFFAHNWIGLKETVRAPVDPVTYIVPSLIGLFILILGFGLFLEWRKSEKKNNLLPIPFFGSLFSLGFIILTWLFADINSIFTGVHAYLNIPAIGTSVALAAILTLFFEQISAYKFFKQKKIIPIFIVVLIFFIYFKISAHSVDGYFSHWLNNGLAAVDQQRISSQFWNEVGLSKQYSLDNLPLIYLETPEAYGDGTFYSETIYWQLASWFDLKFNNNKDKRFNSCTFEIFGKGELKKFVKIVDGTLTSNKCGQNKHKLEDFFAFRLKNRDLIPDTEEVLKELKNKQ